MILAGDIGGTKTNIGLFRASGEELRVATYPSREYPGLQPIITDLLSGETVTAACFGIAGPVRGNRVKTSNLPWHIDGDQLASLCGIPTVLLINDLQATAEGIPALEPDGLGTLNEGQAGEHATSGQGTAAMIAAGTGLGMAIVSRAGGQWTPLPTEGGHQSFAPRNDDEISLWKSLQSRFGHVSVERVVSGPGLHNIYQWVRDVGEHPVEAEVAGRIANGGPAAEISYAAQTRQCPACEKALHMFLSAYGAAAGNLALVTMATGGLYVGGGIAPKLWPTIANGLFLAGFLEKGRYRQLLESMPVRVIKNPRTALLGAARRAVRLAKEKP